MTKTADTYGIIEQWQQATPGLISFAPGYQQEGEDKMNHRNDIVIGLGMGDEGKGTAVDWLTSLRPVEYVIRSGGGPQNAHNVVLPDGTHHTFAQFGSGTLRGVKTIVSRYCLVNPFNMATEADALAPLIGRDPFEIARVSAHAPLITPLHQAANYAREIARGDRPHGSCGQGVGEAQLYRLQDPTMTPYVADLQDLPTLAAKLQHYATWLRTQFPAIDLPDIDDLMASYTAFAADNRMQIVTEAEINTALHEGYNVFEGSQGVLLDEWYGFHPHTTWSTTTAANAQRMLADAGLPSGHVIGVTRTYTTRHGAGPFPTEFPADYDWHTTHPEAHNVWGRWQGDWRVGPLDLPLLRYGVQVAGQVDEIMLTHADVPVATVIDAYVPAATFLIKKPASRLEDLDYQADITRHLFNLTPAQLHVSPVTGPLDIAARITTLTGVPVTTLSYGKTAADKREVTA